LFPDLILYEIFIRLADAKGERTKMTQKIEEQSRRQIAEFLPETIQKALSSYQKFMKKEHDDAKNFKAHHDACKVAIAHIQLLIELANWADLLAKDDDNAEYEALADMLLKAKTEIQCFSAGA
jgi:hypothetical protein